MYEKMHLKGVDVQHAKSLGALSPRRGVHKLKDGILVVRWISDRWGNAWLSEGGSEARYMIPCHDRDKVKLADCVRLIVRHSGVDYAT